MLNKKPKYLNQKPLYFPQTRKKSKRILIYAICIIGIIIIATAIFIFLNFQKEEGEPKMSSIEGTILEEIQKDSILKEEILGTSGDINWNNFPVLTKERIENMVPYFLNCIAKVCEPEDSCSLGQEEIEEFGLENKEFYSPSVLISSGSQNSRLVKLFCWGVDKEIEGVIKEEEYEEEDGEESVCVPETDNAFCLRYGKDCNAFSGADNCGIQRTVNCGTCISSETCGGSGISNVCGKEGCVPETDRTFCSRYDRDCSIFSGTDNCEKIRVVNCGYCNEPEICGGSGISNVCGEPACVAETDSAFCSRQGKNCDTFSGLDNCGEQRTVNCGGCVSPEICGGGGLENVCGEPVCVAETNQEFCSRYNKECGSFSGLDNCGEQRTVNCGGCVSPKICTNNICVSVCQPSCTGKCGGPNGCGGTCPNTCTGGLVCKAPSYKSCGPKESVELLGRSLIALSKNNGIYLGWRLLPWDNANIGFNVYRATSASGPFTKINSAPIKTSTNYYHQNVASGTYYYLVRTVNSKGVEGPNSNLAKVKTGTSSDYISIPLQGRSDNARDVAEIMPADLNGDGVVDFVLLMGYDNKDDSDLAICKDTSLRLEAIMSNPDGTWSSAWRVDTSYKGMNCGNRVGFLSAWDLTGDGKAEIITRWGSGGSLAVLNGENGSVIASKAWPHWNKKYAYIAIGLLEDVNNDKIADPFIVLQVGSYGSKNALFTAYRLEGNNLVEKKRMDVGAINSANAWDSDHPHVWGIGTHGLITADLNNDGNDEVVPCGSIMYPDWSGYWVVNFGHCDGCFVGDLNPNSPGPEVFMACEKPREAMLVRVLAGQKPQRFWTFNSNTYHPHHLGFHKGHCGDISVAGYSGMVCWGLELDNSSRDGTGNTRVFTISGTEITKKYNWPFRMWMQWPVDWNTGDQTDKILYMTEYYFVADVIGDAREEYPKYIQNSNTLRIYTNTNLLNSRHVTPLADRGYRSGVARQGNGYPTARILMKTNQPRLDLVPVL